MQIRILSWCCLLPLLMPLIACAATPALTEAATEPVPVVASFSILGDMVQTVGGAQVQVTTLVGPNGDAHVYQPTPRDAKAISEARIVVMNGLGFEGWIDRLIKSSGFTGRVVVASTGVVPDNHGATDPHAWQDLKNGMIYVHNIATALMAADPNHAADYQRRAQDYLARLQALDQEVRAQLATLPPRNRRLITSHDAFGYFATAYGMTILAPVGTSTEAEASAADVAALIRQIRREQVKAIFMENITDPRLVERIAAETGVSMGGTLYSDALSETQGPAATYLAMFRNNLRVFMEALRPTMPHPGQTLSSPP